jgi:hypothetical protein
MYDWYPLAELWQVKTEVSAGGDLQIKVIGVTYKPDGSAAGRRTIIDRPLPAEVVKEVDHVSVVSLGQNLVLINHAAERAAQQVTPSRSGPPSTSPA